MVVHRLIGIRSFSISPGNPAPQLKMFWSGEQCKSIMVDYVSRIWLKSILSLYFKHGSFLTLLMTLTTNYAETKQRDCQQFLWNMTHFEVTPDLELLIAKVVMVRVYLKLSTSRVQWASSCIGLSLFAYYIFDQFVHDVRIVTIQNVILLFAYTIYSQTNVHGDKKIPN